MTTEIQEYSATEAAIAELNQKYKGVVFDVTKKEDMTAAKAARGELRKYRIDLEAKRVEIKAPALERCRLIDAEAKRITAELTALEDPIAAQIKVEEDRIQAEKDAKEAAERARIVAIQQNMEKIREMPVATFGCTAAELKEYITQLEARVIDAENFGDFVAEAEALKANVLLSLNQTMQTKIQMEEAEARNKAQAEELARKAAEQAAIDAEAARKREEAERESRRKIEEEERAARLQREEADRKARQEREEQETKERAARQAEEDRQREIQRKEMAKLDARETLRVFAEQHAEEEEFAGVVQAINKYFEGLAKAA